MNRERAQPAERSLDGHEAEASFSQERFWFLDRWGAGPTLNIPMALRVRGPLDLAALERAFDALVARHEVLRTCFRQGPRGLRVARVARESPGLETESLSAPDDELETTLEARALEEAERPFDLERGPLVRFRCLTLGADHHLLLVTAHHSVWDRGSTGILLNELGRDYQQARAGKELSHRAHEPSYPRFAAGQRASVDGPDLARSLDYWRRQLEDSDPLELPCDHPRPAIQGHKSGVVDLEVPADLGRELRRLARSVRGSAATLFGAAFAVLLARVTARRDVAFGLPVSHRTRPELEGLIGPLLNTVVVRTRLAGDPSFLGEVLPAFRSEALDALQHQAVPFEVLVAKLGVPRDPSRHPLFQVLFSWLGERRESLDLGPARVTPLGKLAGGPEQVEARTLRTPLDLELRVLEHGEGFLCRWVYDRDLFDAARIRRMAEGFGFLLEAIRRHPQGRVSELPLMSQEEEERVQELGQGPALARPFEGVWSRIEERARQHPERRALQDAASERGLRFGELVALAQGVAADLRRMGLRPGDPVGLSIERSTRSVVALLGALAAGTPFVPLNPRDPREHRRQLLERAGATHVLVDPDSRVPLPEGVRGLGVTLETRESSSPDPWRPTPDSVAYVLFTSGSSGVPKGVLGRHGGLAGRLDWERRARPFEDHEVACHRTVSTFIDSLAEILGPLAAGVPLVVLSEEEVLDPRALVDRVARFGVTRLTLVPSHLATLVETVPELGARWSALRHLTSSGEVLPPQLAERLLSELPRVRLWNLYGSTEVSGDATALEVRPAALEREVARLPIGTPLDGVRLEVRDPFGAPVPVGVPGELFVGGEGLAAGYCGDAPDSDRFERRGSERFFRTGDRVVWNERDQLEFLGRLDGQLKIRGVRIEPRQIERALESHTLVRRAAVVAREETPGTQRLEAFFLSESEIDPRELRSHLGECLPGPWIPSKFTRLASFPETSSGKLDRRALRTESAGVSRSAPTAFDSGTAATLASIWGEVLEAPLGVEEDFFQTGGHSLQAARAVARVGQVFGRELPLRSLFQHSTPASYAAWLEGTPRQSPRATVPIPERTVGPASFAQERFWTLERLGAGQALHLPQVLQLEPAPREADLEAALRRLEELHPVLRTTFALESEGVVQRVHSSPRVSMRTDDLGSLAPAERERELTRIAHEEADAPFDLARGPLWRARLVRVDARAALFFWTFHHAVADAGSLQLLRSELAQLLASDSEERPLAEEKVSYVELAARERLAAQSEGFRQELEYWKTNLRGSRPAELWPDRPRPPRKGYRSACSDLELDPGSWEEVQAFVRKRSLTPGLFFLGLWQAVLSRLLDSDDLLTALAMGTRTTPDVERTVGPLLNVLLLRLDARGDPGFEQDLLPRVRQSFLDGQAQARLPFEELVRTLEPPRDPSRPPLTSIGFQYLDPVPHGSSIQLTDRGLPRTALDLELRVLARPSGALLRWVYDPDLYTEETLRRLGRTLLCALEGVLADPGVRLSEIPLGAEGSGEPPAQRPCADALPSLIRDRAVGEGDRPALTLLDKTGRPTRTYGELAEDMRRYAQAFASLELEPQSRIGVAVGRSLELVPLLLGLQAAGHAYVPLDRAEPAARREKKISGAGVSRLVYEGEAPPTGVEGVPCLRLSEFVEGCGDPGFRPPTVPGESMAYVLHTSGSTGTPKAVAVEHRSLVHLLRAMNRELALGPDDVLLAVTPLAFDIAAFELFGSLLAGASTAIAPAEAAANGGLLATCLESSGATVLQATPTTLRLLADLGWKAPRPMRIVSGGESLPASLARQLRSDPAVTLFNAYGPTETTIWSTLGRQLRDPVHVGTALGATRLEVRDRFEQPLPAGFAGELWIGGPGVARGYLSNPVETAARFREDEDGRRWYRTGDRVRSASTGELVHLGRFDSQVKLRGHRIELEEVQAGVLKHPGVREAAVVLRGAETGARLECFFVGSGSRPLRTSELTETLRRELPLPWIPARFHQLENLPKTASGKLDRAALPVSDSHASSDPPRGPVEEALAALWCEVLERDRVGRRDRFLDLGGHSLLAVGLVDRIQREFGVELQPFDLLFSDLSQLAALCSESARTSEAPSLWKRLFGGARR